jgi:asparagine synthase (glutamine-hydrolysing)
MIAGVRERLVNGVRLRLRADVPVGIYLSGGVDSSAVAGIVTHLVKEEGTKAGTEDIKDKVCNFSITFDETSGYDEGRKWRIFLSSMSTVVKLHKTNLVLRYMSWC